MGREVTSTCPDVPLSLSRLGSFVHMYDDRVGATRPEREMPLARAQYVAAARAFLGAHRQFLARGVPIDPGRDAEVREWTVSDVAVLRDLHQSLGAMLDSRRHWDQLRRAQRSLPALDAGSADPPQGLDRSPMSRRSRGPEDPLWTNLKSNQPPDRR